jgi:chromosome segregation ATPase
MNKYQALISAFSNSTQEQWAVDQVTSIIHENEANVTFICQAQNLMPDVLADLQRLQQIDEALQSKGMDSELEANLKDLKSALNECTNDYWVMSDDCEYVQSMSQYLPEIVHVMNKGSAFISEDEAIANLAFIVAAHNTLPALLEEIERLQWLEAELHRVRDRAGKLESTLHSAVNVLQSMRCQIEQMRGMFEDEDGAIQLACTEHDDVEQLIAQVTAK